MKNPILIFLVLCLLMVTHESRSAIPSTNFVMNQVAANHGKGTYIIDQEVTLREPEGTNIIQERLYVVNGGEILLTARGNDGFSAWRLMKNGRIFWTDGSSEKASLISNDNPAFILFTHNSQDLKQRLLRLGILVVQNTEPKKVPKDLKDIKYEPEPNVRLGRVAGTVTYAYGTPAPITGPLPPGLWIEQDLFVVRKFRAGPDAEFTADDVTEFSKGLWYPRQQTLTFGGHLANVRVTHVHATEFPADIKKQFEPTYMRGRPETTTVWPKSTMTDILQEFYKRFR